jgi:hypothetical protein
MGDEAKAINGLLQSVSARQKEGEAASPEILAQLADVYTRMGLAAEKAAELASRATADGVADVAQQADLLRQQLYSARNRLGLLQKGLSAKVNLLS